MNIKPRYKKQMRLSEMQAEDTRLKAAATKGIDKSATLVKAGVSEGETAGAFSRPNEEQLAKINQFTRTPKTADELYVFDTLSMNDLPDRDDDVFVAETVSGFANLPQPFSPIGKSYMIDHEYKVGNARGRIYDATTEEIDTELGKSLFLRNSIYIPDTPQYADFIEAQDFGINWAVSVGVTLGAADCTVCGSAFSSWGYWCREGHDKGLSYDPASNETDDWGYPVACDPSEPGAVKCLRQFKDPLDFYELSQVFLGAQYFAALDKSAGFSSIKTAGGFLSVPEKLAKQIDFAHEPSKVQEARKKFDVALDPDGLVTWVDDQSIEWIFDPLDPDAEVLCAGRKDASEEDPSEDDDNQEDDEDGAAPSEELGSADGEDDQSEDGGDEEPGEGGDASEDGSEEGSGALPLADEEAAADDSADDSSDDDSGDEDESEDDSGDVDPPESEDSDSEEEDEDDEAKGASGGTKKATPANTAKTFLALLPEPLRASAEKSTAGIAKTIGEYVKGLEVKAELGDEYLKNLQADALAWYTRAHMQPTGHGVKTAAFEKLLAKVGDDPALLKEIIEEHKGIAQKRFPKSARRSSVPSPDLSEKTVPEIRNYESSEVSNDDDQKVAKRHGLKG